MSQAGILGEIREERLRQDAKWGTSYDHPSVDVELVSLCAADSREQASSAMCAFYQIPSESHARDLCESAFRHGEGTYAHLIVEEIAEAISAAVISDEECRAELIQAAALAVKWIEAIDKREAERATTIPPEGSDAK